nr:hypothetical protein [uncultured bacterium]
MRQCTQRTEAAQTAHHFRTTRFLHYAFDSSNQSITRVNINTGIFIPPSHRCVLLSRSVWQG